MTIRSKLFSGFLIVISIFVIDFIANQQLSEEVVRNSQYLSNSEAVIRNSNLLHKYMIEMQSGFRGFLLTSQKSFLDSYYQGLRKVPPLLKEQRSLIDGASRNLYLDSIVELHTAWIKYSNALITTKLDTLPISSLKYQELFEKKLKKEVGKKMNDRINVFFSMFDKREYEIRQERRIRLENSITRTRNISILLNIVSVIIGLLSGMYLIRLITGRIKVMSDFASEISKGNFITIEDKNKDEMNQLSNSLNKMSGILNKNFKELRKKNSELDQFAYVVSHDLKAPLRGIDNLIKWLEEDHPDEISPVVKKNIDLIKGRTKRLENLINGLLEYAKIGRVKKNIETVSVETLLRELTEILVPAKFKIEIQPGMPVLKTEKIRLEQVFSNLISNAVNYHDKENGQISISFKDLGDFYEFAVSDDGPGIEKQYHEKVFMIFQTLKERDAFESTGVGLAIVKKIIEEQKGTIILESEPGKGTTVRFTWPMNILLA